MAVARTNGCMYILLHAFNLLAHQSHFVLLLLRSRCHYLLYSRDCNDAMIKKFPFSPQRLKQSGTLTQKAQARLDQIGTPPTPRRAARSHCTAFTVTAHGVRWACLSGTAAVFASLQQFGLACLQ